MTPKGPLSSSLRPLPLKPPGLNTSWAEPMAAFGEILGFLTSAATSHQDRNLQLPLQHLQKTMKWFRVNLARGVHPCTLKSVNTLQRGATDLTARSNFPQPYRQDCLHMSVLPSLICQNPSRLFTGNDDLMAKFTQKCKVSRIAKTPVKKKSWRTNETWFGELLWRGSNRDGGLRRIFGSWNSRALGGGHTRTCGRLVSDKAWSRVPAFISAAGRLYLFPFFLFCVSLARGLSILLMSSKNQLLHHFFFLIIFLFSMSLIAVIFIISFLLLQFSSVQSLSRVWLFATPWIAARQASLSITNSQISLRLTSIFFCLLGFNLLFLLASKSRSWGHWFEGCVLFW